MSLYHKRLPGHIKGEKLEYDHFQLQRYDIVNNVNALHNAGVVIA